MGMKLPPELEREILSRAAKPIADNPAITKAKGRRRFEPGRMNKLETAFAAHLDLRKAAGEVAGWWFEALKLRLADNTFYFPDFLVMLGDGSLELVEVKATWSTGKAGWKDDSRVKWKVAAEKYPLFAFVAVRRVKGKWVQERYR
jgi:hypothetical protein